MHWLGTVVLTHGREREAYPLLESLLEQGAPADSVVVVHNPTDPADPPLDVPDPGIHVLRAERNRGYAGGMNMGIADRLERGADAVLILTHDIRLREGALSALVDAARAAPAYGILAPVQWVRGRGDELFSYGGVMKRNGVTNHICERPEPTDAGGIARCDWVDGAAMLIRAELVRAAGPFDERFFGYYEESDFCLRATRLGWRVGVALGSNVEQAPGIDRRPGAFAYLSTRNGLEYARQAVGLRGTLVALYVLLRETARETARWTALRTRHDADAPELTLPKVRLAGMWLGARDWVAGRWGPPPATLPGMGDYQNV
jgi:hypothetical protein